MSRLCGLVDFSRCGADQAADKKIDPYVGVPIYYYRCDECGFIFTRAMDQWSTRDFANHIYNEDYARHDPAYLGERPKEHAQLIGENFPEIAQVPMLDFGSGLGLLEKELRSRGFTQIDSYDPYACDARKVPDLVQKYQTVVAFEVFEHHPQPQALMAELLKFIRDDGAILLSTATIGTKTSENISDWWYCVPRNGHISFFSTRALAVLAKSHDLVVGSFNSDIHFFHRDGKVPPWVRKYNKVYHSCK
ncbi:class I SAM-dependent methyltransferase [Paraburkholderia sp. NPDC080076]|uniref:class I SAM-dependent methyltransferase n=1 Tax=Paraburkholderia sp. NPDC080076 TaxID=3390605 RepID=UPI003CFDAA7D